MIKINMDRARSIAHALRRAARDREFAPWDSVIARQIPGTDLAGAERYRQQIRDRYHHIQAQIDQCENINELEKVLATFRDKR